MNAVADPLRGHETRGLEMSVTPEQVWRILHGATAASGGGGA
jgi:hypothetical protein